MATEQCPRLNKDYSVRTNASIILNKEKMVSKSDGSSGNDVPMALDTATRLAIERTRVAYERTVMAAVRTATSLITFGFSAYKFFQWDIGGGAPREAATKSTILAPKEFGLAMILLGLVSLALAWFEYHRDTKALKREYPNLPTSTVGVLAGIVVALGSTLLIIVWFNG